MKGWLYTHRRLVCAVYMALALTATALAQFLQSTGQLP